MPTIAENLQTLIDIKADLKGSLTAQGKEVSDSFATYAGAIDALENPDNIEYLLTVDGETAVYAQLHGEEKVDLTATANDIREGSVAVVNSGVITGEKFIPPYVAAYGTKFALADSEATLDGYETNYNQIMLSLAPYDSSINASTAVNYISIGDSLYEVGTGTKVSDITKDVDNDQIFLGITPTAKSVLRFFVVREEV